MTCTLCKEAEATTTWGFPVCAPCAVFLGDLDGVLRETEAHVEVLAELARQVDDAWQALS